MAIKSITITASPSQTRNKIVRRIAIQVTGNYTQGGAPATVGETVDFTTMLNPAKFPRAKFGGVASSPNAIPGTDEITVASVPYGYDATLVQNPTSPTLKNYILQFFTSGGTELSTGAYPTGLASTDIVFEITQGLRRA